MIAVLRLVLTFLSGIAAAVGNYFIDSDQGKLLEIVPEMQIPGKKKVIALFHIHFIVIAYNPGPGK